MGVFSCVAVTAEAGQTIVGDLQNKAVVHHTVGGLKFTMGEDNTVVEEQHALNKEEKRVRKRGREGEDEGGR